jgi:hypothetical protein
MQSPTPKHLEARAMPTQDGLCTAPNRFGQSRVIQRGVVPAFRNRTHHHILDNFSQEDAIRVCGFIDVLLRVVDTSVKVK